MESLIGTNPARTDPTEISAAPRRLAVGILLPTRDGATAGQPARELIALAVEAEQLGYDSVWVGDSVIARPRHEPFTVLAAVAGATERVRLGTAVLISAVRNPVHLAHCASTVDALSGGRLILGIGIGPSYGPSRREFAALGVPFERRFERTIEGIALCRRLWSQDSVIFDGDFHSVHNVTIEPKPAQPGGPPIWLGGKGERALGTAGRLLDGWLPGPRSPERFGADLRHLRAETIAAGRPRSAVTAAVYESAMIEDKGGRQQDRSKALRSSLESYYQQPYELVAALNDTCVGTAAEIETWLQRYADAGAEHVVLRLLGPNTRAQMHRLAAFLHRLSRPRAPSSHQALRGQITYD